MLTVRKERKGEKEGEEGGRQIEREKGEREKIEFLSNYLIILSN